MPSFDPIASFEITAVEANIAGRLLRIPPLPASEWLPFLMQTSDAMRLLELLEADPTDELFDAGLASADDVRSSLEGMLAVAAGCPAWAAYCLGATLREHWGVLGSKLLGRVPFDSSPLGAVLVSVYGLIVDRLDEKTLSQFNLWLDTPMLPNRQSRQRPKFGPVPANAEQYVRTRPKTQPRRPQDRLADQNAQPTSTPQGPADSGPQASVFPQPPVDGGAVSPPLVSPASDTAFPQPPTPL